MNFLNRAERRRLEKAGQKEPVINMKSSDVLTIKKDAVNEAVDTAFILMLGIPVMILHDKYSLLMKKEVDGKSRTERFADLCLDLYDSYNKGYLTLDDIHQYLWEEAGIKLERGIK